MAKIRPTKQYAMMVVPHRPHRVMFLIFALSFTFLVAVIGSYYLGRYYSIEGVPGGNRDVTVEYEALKQTHKTVVEESAALEQQVANLKLATEVDRKANEEVRSKVVQLETQLAELEQDNTFYRSLMRPDPSDKGLVVDPPSVVPGSAVGRYSYNIVIKQIVAKHRQVRGYAVLEILGKQGENLRRLAFKDISDSIAVERIKLNFKYFQRLEGEMDLPEGFVPERIEMKLVISQPNKAIVDKKFGWLVKES